MSMKSESLAEKLRRRLERNGYTFEEIFAECEEAIVRCDLPLGTTARQAVAMLADELKETRSDLTTEVLTGRKQRGALIGIHAITSDLLRLQEDPQGRYACEQILGLIQPLIAPAKVEVSEDDGEAD